MWHVLSKPMEHILISMCTPYLTVELIYFFLSKNYCVYNKTNRFLIKKYQQFLFAHLLSVWFQNNKERSLIFYGNHFSYIALTLTYLKKLETSATKERRVWHLIVFGLLCLSIVLVISTFFTRLYDI